MQACESWANERLREKAPLAEEWSTVRGPKCRCGEATVLRRGPTANHMLFWGCVHYPRGCRQTFTPMLTNQPEENVPMMDDPIWDMTEVPELPQVIVMPDVSETPQVDATALAVQHLHRLTSEGHSMEEAWPQVARQLQTAEQVDRLRTLLSHQLLWHQ